MFMFCPNCGAAVKDGAKFCASCGKPLPVRAPAPEAAAPVVEAPAPVVEAAAPVVEAAAPVVEAAAPVVEAAAPVVEAAAPAVATMERPAPVQTPPPARPVQPVPPTPPAPPVAEPPKKKSRTGLIIGIVAGVVVLAASAAALWFFVLNKPAEIDPSRYLEVEFDGLNGEGYAWVGLDWEGLVEEIAKAKKLESLDLTDDDVPEKWEGIVDVLEGLKITVKNTSTEYIWLDDGLYEGPGDAGLSNGDTFVLKVVADDAKAAKKQGLVFKDTEETFTVEGLTVKPEVDPFDGLTFELNGEYSGGGYLFVEYEGSRDDIYGYMFTAEPWEDLSNGDTVTITFDCDEEWCEFIPTRTEMTYTVEGLPEYLTRYEDLDDAAFAALDADAQSIIFDSVQFVDADAAYPEFCGWALAVAPEVNYYDNNVLYLIYKAQIGAYNPAYVPFTAYFPVRYTDVMNTADVLENAFTSGYVTGSFMFLTGEYGINYGDGYVNPYELCGDLRDDLSDGWTLTFGGEAAEWDTGEDNLVRARSQISDAAMEQIHDCALAEAEMTAEDDFGDLGFHFSDFRVLGEYTVVDPAETEDPGLVTTLAVIVEAHVTHDDGDVDLDTWFVVQYSEIYYTPDGVFVGSHDGMLYADDGSCALDQESVVWFFTENLRDTTDLVIEVSGSELRSYGT